MGLPSSPVDNSEPSTNSCCNPELYGILTSIVLQDLPFLCVRLTLIFYYHVVSYTNMFFTSKNTLVIVLLMYRLIVVHNEARKRRRKYLETTVVTSPLKLNGHQKNGRELRYGRKSKSVPNVNTITENNTLPRRNKKKGNGRAIPAHMLPTISSSVSESQFATFDKDQRRKSAVPLDRPKSASSLEKHRV